MPLIPCSQLMVRGGRHADDPLPAGRAFSRPEPLAGSLMLGLLAACLLAWSTPNLHAQTPADEAATRQYNAAAALQNRQQFDLAIDEWNRFITGHTQDARLRRARYYLGVCQFAAGQYAAAAGSLEQVLKQAGELEPIDAAQLYLGLAQFNLGRAGDAKQYEAAAATLAALSKQFPESPHRPRGLYYQAEALYALGKRAEAVPLYAELADKHTADPLHADALYALGVARDELGQRAEARTAYEAFVRKYPQHELAAEVTMRQAETLLADGKGAEAEPLFARAAGSQGFSLADRALVGRGACLYQMGRYTEAAAVYGQVVRDYPQSPLRAAAQLSAGECACRAEQHEQAITWLQPLAAGTGDAVPAATHWLARAHLAAKQPDKALAAIDRIGRTAASSPLAAQLALDRADALYELPGRRGEAGAAYAELADRFGQSPLAAEAAYMAALVALGEQDYDTALARSATFEKQHSASDWANDVELIAAESLLRLKRFAEAEQRYARLLERQPRDPQTNAWLLRRATCLLLDKQHDRVVQLLEPALRGLADPQQRAEAQYLVGSSQYERGKFAEAAGLLEASLASAPRGPHADDALLVLAFALRQRNDLPGAIRRLEQLVADFPESDTLDRAWFRLGEYTLASGKPADAANWYRRLIDARPDSPLAGEATFGLGWCQLESGDPEAAIASFNRALQSSPDDRLTQRLYLARARALEQLNRYSLAIDDLQLFLKGPAENAQKAEARHLLGLCQEGVGQPEAAVKTYRALLSEIADYADADKVWYALAWSLNGLKQTDESVAAFAELVKRYPESSLAAEGHFHVAQQQYDAGQYAEAARSYYQAMERAGKSDLGERAAYRLGWAYFRKPDYPAARKTFAYQRATWPRGPLVADAAYMEGESIFKQAESTADARARGRLWSEAVACYEQVKQPAQAEFALLAMLQAARALGQAGQWERALQWVQTAGAVEGAQQRQGELLFEEAQARLNLGQADRALPLFEQVAELSSDEVSARARFAVGELHFQRKDHREAIRNFFKVPVYGFAEWSAAAGYEAGRCFEVLGDAAQARQSYHEVADQYPNTQWAAAAQQRLKQLAAK